ncbi:type I restriction endonuclease subunit R [Patescibacteria group bacterium]|nr:type I restriction endonuclease subunit R [Patescibacteria group bacterium]
MTHNYYESDLEQATLEWLEEIGYKTIYGPSIDPEAEDGKAERKNYSEVILVDRLKFAIERINPNIPIEAQQDAVDKVLGLPWLKPNLVENNYAMHKMLTDGVDITYKDKDGLMRGDKVYLVDKNNLDNNDWLAVNQFTVKEDNKTRRPDVVIFINGLPLAIIELKNPADENATIIQAYNQIQTYKQDIQTFFTYNSLVVVSDGVNTRIGSLTANEERFMKWRTIDGSDLAPASIPEMEVLIKGVFDKKRILDILLNFIIFNTDGENTIKILAAYHQYHAVNKAVIQTIEATKEDGDRRCGVVWHTQGSGKSLTMVFYAGKLIQVLDNPTIVVLTDRNDLDEQLSTTFSLCQDLIRQTPVQAESRMNLKELLKVASGGVVFTTIQKFSEGDEMLSNRKNIVVCVDEAHRSQYDFMDGFARHMREALPNASFIGFTGTPIELTDANTRAVFGEYIDVYDIAQAVEDKATVPIYYEARLAKIQLLESERPKIDPKFEELTEGEEADKKEKLKSKWAKLEAMVGSEKRIGLIAQDIVSHFKQRSDVINGKGMIVTMSRRIAVELYDEIIKLRPHWHSDNDEKGFLKVVITGSATDPLNFQKHIRSKQARKDLAKHMKKPSSDLKLVIVRDMWLTGFDVPSLHTMYLDKPMQGHGLMQAIARVNRIYKDKQGGLVVDYLGIAPMLKEALAYYTNSGRNKPTIPQEEAVSVMLEKYEVVKGMYHNFDYSDFFSNKASKRTRVIASSIDFILGLTNGKKRYVQVVTELSYAFSLSVPNEEAIKIRDEVAFFQVIKGAIVKMEDFEKQNKKDIGIQDSYDQAIKQIISHAITSDEVVNVFTAAGLKNPNVSVLSDEFLEEVKNLKYKNLALEILKKLLNNEIKTMTKKNLIKSRSFAKLLQDIIRKYQNQTIDAAQVIYELVELAKKIKNEETQGESLGLSVEEVAFYDALIENESAVLELGDDVLKQIARELVSMLRKNTTIDWTLKESIRAKLRLYVKKLLKKYKYPPDKQENATRTVLEQAEVLCKDWSGK